MISFLLYSINSAIFDYSVPRIFDTINNFTKYNPNLYNYEIIHKDFYKDKCLKSNQYTLNRCIDLSIKKFYNPFSLISKNNNNNFFQLSEYTSKYSIHTDMKIQTFWLKCAQKGNNRCAQLYDTFNFFHIDNYPEEYITNQYEYNNTIYYQLKEAHNLMYNIFQYPKIVLESQNNTIQRIKKENDIKERSNTNDQSNATEDINFESNHGESETSREARFKKAYEILKPIAFLAFEKYIADHFGYLRPLHRFNQTLVENVLGYKRSYQDELRILLEGKQIMKNPSWMFDDLIYPEVARLFKDIMINREDGPEKPLNEIYANLLYARYPYLFEKGFDEKKKYLGNSEINNQHISKKVRSVKDNLQTNNTNKSTPKPHFDHSINNKEQMQILHSSNNLNMNKKTLNRKSDHQVNEDEFDNFFEYDDDDDFRNVDFEGIDEFSNERTESNDNDDFYEFYYYYYDNEKEPGSRPYVYDYYFDNAKKTIDNIHVKKGKHNRHYLHPPKIDDKMNYNEASSLRLRYAFDLCRNYLDQIDDIESLNQTNLTTTIATIYGISSLFHHTNPIVSQEKIQSNNSKKKRQLLKQIHFFDQYDLNNTLISCKLVDENLYYLIIAAKNNGIKASEALLFKFLLLLNNNDNNSSSVNQNIIDNFFNYIIFCLDQTPLSPDDNSYQQQPPNIYNKYHNSFQPIVADFFDAIIFFDRKSRNIFHVSQIENFNSSSQSNHSESLNMTNEQDDQGNDSKISSQNEEENATIDNKTDLLKIESDDENVYKNPRNWTYEDAAKALRNFIDSSFLVQVGHLAEEALSCHSSLLSFSRDISRSFVYAGERLKIFDNIADKFSNLLNRKKSNNTAKSSQNGIDDDDFIIVNNIEINKQAFHYALKVYQTLAMAGNRDAMWNAHILMKAAKMPSQIFTMFITDSNETVFLHELDARHRSKLKMKSKVEEIINEQIYSAKINKTNSKESVNETEIVNNTKKAENNRAIGQFLWNHLSVFFSKLHSTIKSTINSRNIMVSDENIDYDFYEEISDRDPYAAFTLAWKKRDNLTASYELLDKTENMKPEAKVAVVISKLIITTLSFINSIFSDQMQVSMPSHTVDSSSSGVFQKFLTSQKYLRFCELVKSTPYLPEILLGFGILASLAFLIYIRISLYCV